MHRQVSNGRDLRPLDVHAISVLIHLEHDGLAAEHEQIGVLGDNSVNVALLLEKAQLGVGFIRGDNVLDVFYLQGLTRKLNPV